MFAFYVCVYTYVFLKYVLINYFVSDLWFLIVWITSLSLYFFFFYCAFCSHSFAFYLLCSIYWRMFLLSNILELLTILSRLSKELTEFNLNITQWWNKFYKRQESTQTNMADTWAGSGVNYLSQYLQHLIRFLPSFTRDV